MTSPLIPPNETDRLADLYAYGVLDTEREKIFDEFTHLAATICGTPYAAVTFIDQDRQWLKAEYGSPIGQYSRNNGVCGHAILASELFEVPDTRNDPRFAENTWLNDAGVRFYSGCQLNSSRGNAIGMLCVMDSEPRSLSTCQKLSLAQLANVVMAVLEAGRQSRMLSWLGALVDTVTDDILVLDPATLHYLYANAAAVRNLGYSLDQLCGMTVLDVNSDISRDKLLTYVRQLQDGERQVEFESLRRRSNGEIFPVLVRWQLLSNLGHSVILSMVHDISVRKQIEHIRSEFISVVSHELRTPLTSIYGAVKLLEKGLAGTLPEPAAKLVSLAVFNTNRLRKMVEDILDLEKLTSGQIEFVVEPLLANVVLERLAMTYGSAAQAAGVLLKVQAAPDLHLYADVYRLDQVLANLVSNAINVAPKGSTVLLIASDAALPSTPSSSLSNKPGGTARLGTAVRLQVADCGPGIPAHFHPHIFQRFAQANMQSNRQKGGAGLGLSIAKQMVECMHGSIGFSSQPGCTTFEVIFPGACR
jgi:PAS domain S-box-containing protein